MQINTKVNIGDEIFFMSENTVKTSVVSYIKIEVTDEKTQFGARDKISILYHTGSNNRLYEHKIFLTKQELLDSL